MNTVNKEVAAKLKEAGFDESVAAYYASGEIIYHCSSPKFINSRSEYIAAPDPLTAVDFLWEKWMIYVTYRPDISTVTLPDFESGIKIFDSPDHRNEALLFALNQIKK